MTSGHTVADRQDAGPFLELGSDGPSSTEPCLNELDEETSRGGRTTHQPWRAFWPTHPGDDLHEIIQSAYPDVLSWRFDKGKLFEQPWRTWTSIPYTKLENNSLATGTGEGTQTRYIEEFGTNSPNESPVAPHVRRTRQLIDEVIEELGLPSVKPPTFHYLAPLKLYQSEKPFRCQLPKVSGYRMNNIKSKKHDVTIHNISGHEDLFKLDECGFEFTKCPVGLSTFTDESVASEYLPNLARWLKSHLDCEDVFFYAFNMRKSGIPEAQVGDWKPPFFRAHCDASDRTHIPRLQLYFPDTWSELMERRIRLINVWKPLSTPVQDCPLAMCDFRTVNKQDLIAMDLVYPHLEDEAYEIFYSPSHRWFYKKDMDWDDAIVFKLHDTMESVATVCPHSAFIDPTAPKGAPPRASIEVKAIVVG